MAATLVDNVRINITSLGTGALALGSAVDGYRGIEALQNGKTYNYKVVAGAQWEVGQGQYLSSGAQLVRTPLYSSNGDGLVDLAQNAQVSFVALSTDFNGTGLSADAITARDQAVAASILAQDAASAAQAIVDPVSAIPTDGGASIVGTSDGGKVQDFIDYILSDAGSSNVGHKQLWSGAITTTVQGKLRTLPHIYDIILAANRSTSYDAAAALNAALASGERFVLPNTEIRFGSGLTLTNDNGGFIGQGKGSRLVGTFATGDMLTIGNGTDQISGARFENFTLFSSVNRTGGAAIHATKCTDSEFLFLRLGSRDDDAAIGNYHYDGIYLDRFSDADIIGGEIVGKNELIKLRGDADQSIGAECTMGGGLLLYKGAVGVHVGGGCGGIKMESMDISIAATGLLIDQALTATYNREVIVQPACSIDSCTGNNIVIDQATSSVARFIFRGNWCAGSVGHGIWVKNANGARVFVSSMLYANGGDGLRIDDASAYVVFAGEADINTGYGVNPTVTTSRLTMRPGAFFLGNTAGDFNRTYNPLVFDYATSKSLFKMPAYTVATLPSAATTADSMAIVSDANSPTAGSIVTGGGTTRCIVWSDGTNWRVVART